MGGQTIPAELEFGRPVKPQGTPIPLELEFGRKPSSTSAPSSTSTPVSSSDRLILNVGGKLFETSRETLSSYPDSLLGRMFDPSNSSSLPKPDESTGVPAYFFDRNGDLFAPILDFYRTGRLFVPTGVSPEALRQELDYFGVWDAVAVDGGGAGLASSSAAGAAVGNSGSGTHFNHGLFPHRTLSQEDFVTHMVYRSQRTFEKAFREGTSSFAVSVDVDGRYEGVPQILMLDRADRQWWDEFCFAFASSEYFRSKFLERWRECIVKQASVGDGGVGGEGEGSRGMLEESVRK
ncbi:hypothetical protein HK102_009917, partial [Quaeritorhiza haematococci]